MNINKDRLNKIFTPNRLKFEDKYQKRVKDRVVNLHELVDDFVEVYDVMEILKNKISSRLNINLVEGKLLEEEIKEAEELYQNKYSLDS